MSAPTLKTRRLLLAAAVVVAVLAAPSAGVVPGVSTPLALAQVSDVVSAPTFFQDGDGAARFHARSPEGAVVFTPGRVVLPRTTVTFAHADADVELVGVDRRRGIVNYLLGSDRSRWRTNLPTFAGVVYRGLYPGIDLRYGSSPTAWLTATYTVSPGAAPERIRWHYAGGSAPAEAAAAAWQRIGGRRVAVAARYRLASDGRSVGFELGRYDPLRPLVIRSGYLPETAAATAAGLVYSTYLGGTKWDEAYDIEVDAAGNAYVAGFTFSSDFRTANARQGAFGGVVDAFVAKISADGQTLLYSTYLGGNKVDVAHGLAVDRSGNAYVTGRTESANFPVANARQRGLRGRDCQRPKKRPGMAACNDAFVTKLAPNGNALRYSTYLGGRHPDEALAIAVDRGGNAYVTGNTESTDFPTRRAVQRRFGALPCEGELPCPSDVFVTKLSANGRSIRYSTYLGGRMSERAAGIAVDSAGNAYVTGTTRSTNFPTRNALQRTIRGTACGPPPVACPDVFVAKLAAGGRPLRYSTYLGGSEPESASGIAVDGAGSAYLTGSTQSNDFPTASALQASLDNSSCSSEAPPKELCADAFVSKLSPDGRSLRYSTYLAGSAEDQGLGIAVDRAGNAYVAGSTTSRNFRTANGTQPMGGYIDAFVSKLGPDGGALVYSTFLGGSKAERSNAIAVDSAGRAYLAGRTQSSNFPTGRPLQAALSGDIDAFVTKIE